MNIQNKFKKANVIYKITKDYDLDGSTLIIPVGCTLDFQGGSFANGTINFNDTALVGLINFNNIATVGSIINDNTKIEWFGGGITKNDTINDSAFKAAIKLAYNSKISTVILGSGTYNISEPIVLFERMTLRGDTRLNTIIQKTSNSTYQDIDCVIYLDKSENYSLNYTEYISITNLRIVNVTNTPIEHAIYGNIAPYTKIENIGITGTNIGITIRASWLSEISRVNANVLKRGINIDSTTSNTTTLKLSNIYVLGTSEYGYYLKSVTYSEMENLALDQATNGIGYHLEYFTGSINGIGCESTKLRTVVECVRAVVTMTGVNFWGQKDINTPTTNDSMFKLSAICNVIIESGNFSNGTGSIVDIPTKFLIMYNNCRLTLRNIRNNLNFTVKSTIDGNGTNVTIDDHEKTFQTQNAIAYIGANNKAAQSLEGSNYNIGDGIDCNNAIILNSSRLPTVRNSNGTNVEYFHPLENGTLILNNKPNEDGSIGSVITSNLDEEVTFLGTVSEINGNYFKMTSYVPESNNKSTYIQIRTVLQVGSVISSVVEIIGSGIRLYSGTERISVGDKVSIPIPSRLGQETYSKIPLILPVLPGNEPTQATTATPIFSIIDDIPLWRNASASGWVDSKGNLSQKYTGIFDEKPNSAYLKKGFKYYCTDLECFIIFNGDTWINEDGTLCSKVLYTSDITSFTRSNFTYKIIKDIDLQGETLTLPANCTLDFQGGSIVNGSIVAPNIKNTYLKPEWFGAKGNGIDNDSSAFQMAVNMCASSNCKVIELSEATYLIDNIIIPSDITINGSDKYKSVLKSYANPLNLPILVSDDTQGNNIVLRNLTIESSGQRTEYTVKILNKVGVIVDNCYFVRHTIEGDPSDYHGIFIGRKEGTETTYITKFTNNRVNQCCVTIEGTDGYIDHNEIWGIGCQSALHLVKSGNHMISNNQIVGGSEHGAIYCTGWATALKLFGNYFDGSSTIVANVPYGLNVDCNFTYCIISNNNFWHIYGTAIRVKTSIGCVFNGNIFENNDTSDTGFPDITLENTQSSSITNNSFIRVNVTRTNKAPVLNITGHTSTDYEPIIISGNIMRGYRNYSSAVYTPINSTIKSVDNNTQYFEYISNDSSYRVFTSDGEINYVSSASIISDPLSSRVYTYLEGGRKPRLDNLTYVDAGNMLTNKFDFSTIYNKDFMLYIGSSTQVDNAPTWLTGGMWLENYYTANGYCIQKINGAGVTYVRTCSNNIWSSWYKTEGTAV